MQTMIVKIVLGIVLVISILFAGNHYIGEYTNAKQEVTRLETAVSNLNDKVIEINAAKKKNEDLLQKKIDDATKATIDAVAIYTQSQKKITKLQGELNETNIKYSDLINNGFRLRLPTDKASGNSDGLRGSSDGKEGDSTIAGSSNNGTNTSELSETATRFFVTQAINADAVVGQLLIVQDYAVKQHQWILNQCNATEATNIEK